MSAQGRNYVFPPSAEVGIGIAETADVVLRAPGVSEHHARLAAKGGTWFLFDNDSAGGTWAGGRRIIALALTRPVSARLGDAAGGADISLELVSPPPGAAPVLVTRLGREQRTFPVGMPVRVGRDPSLELVSLSPLVSLQVHGVIVSDARGATYTDQSRRGTFLDGKPRHQPLRITQSVVLRLGDPATGEELGITPPLSSTQLARNRGRRLLAGRVRVGAAVAAAVVVVGGLAAVATAVTRSPTPARAGARPVPRRRAAPPHHQPAPGTDVHQTPGGSTT